MAGDVDSNRRELLHEAWPGYRAAFWDVFILASVWLAWILVGQFW
jgi:hypothetical protein